MVNEYKNYGFRLNDVADPKAWEFGGVTSLPKIILNPDGNWKDYLPSEELQHTDSFDTFGCTVYGTENVFQTLEKFITGETREYDERFIYNLARIIPPGADPHDVAEAFRRHGIISDRLPMTETLAEFMTPRPMTEALIAEGLKYPRELRHEWVWKSPVTRETRVKLMRECLRYSPLGISVTAWIEDQGLYVDAGLPNTHWTMCFHIDDEDRPWIYDSYHKAIKTLHPDHNIQVCKRYQLVPRVKANWWTELWRRLWR
jgi:hypothetical protein